MSYDLNGNILSLQRYAGGQVVNDFAYSYDGNRLVSLADSGSEGLVIGGGHGGTGFGGAGGAGSVYSYDYDANGNMTYDGANNLSLSYNHLNLIEKVSRNGTVLANYSYLADGTKLSALDNDGNGLVYAGSLVYRKQNGVLALESAPFSGGRFMATEGSNGTIYTPLYYLTDHLGSVRAVVDGATGEVIETNDYYPFGMRWVDPNQPVSDNRYRYNGKEEQNFLNLPFIDYGARMRDPKYGIGWNRLDDLSEVTPGISPFAFCLNNPINAFDPDGRDVYAINAKGKLTFQSESDEHWLYLVDRKGNYQNDKNGNKIGVQVSNGKILKDLYGNQKARPLYDAEGNAFEQEFSTFAETGDTGGGDMANVFSFVGKNTDSEWSLSYGTKTSGESVYGLSTDGDSQGVITALSGQKDVVIKRNIHSHSAKELNNGIEGETYSLGSDRWNAPKRSYRFYVYMAKSGNVWQVSNQNGAISNKGPLTPAQLNKLLREK